MAAAQQTPGRAEPVERFRPTSGQLVGNLTLVGIGAVVVYLAFTERTLTGLRVATGVVFFGVLVWLTVLRPRATAYPDALHIHNSVRDMLIPYVAIDEVTLGRVLSVWVGDRRHVCTGIGAPMRRPRSSRFAPGAAHTEDPAKGHTEIRYPDYVRSRIESLVEDARRRASRDGGTTDARPRPVWAVPQMVALMGTGAAFVITLLL